MNIYVGMKLFGNCDGYFGRLCSGEKRIEAFGADWIVVRESNGYPLIATFDSTEEMETFVLDNSEDLIDWEELFTE